MPFKKATWVSFDLGKLRSAAQRPTHHLHNPIVTRALGIFCEFGTPSPQYYDWLSPLLRYEDLWHTWYACNHFLGSLVNKMTQLEVGFWIPDATYQNTTRGISVRPRWCGSSYKARILGRLTSSVGPLRIHSQSSVCFSLSKPHTCAHLTSSFLPLGATDHPIHPSNTLKGMIEENDLLSWVHDSKDKVLHNISSITNSNTTHRQSQ